MCCECKVDLHGVFMGALRAEYICWSYHNAIRSFLCFAAEAITHHRDTWLHSDCHTHIHSYSHAPTHSHTLVLKYLTSTWNAIEMRLLTHSTRARNSIWIFPVISDKCRGRGRGQGRGGGVGDKELRTATTRKRYRHLTDCSNSWFCEKLTKHARTSTRTSVRMSTLIHSLVLSLRWRNDGGSGALLFVILALQISLFSTHHLANFHAGETKDLGNKLAPFGLGATAELHPFLGSVASILSRRVAWSLPATRTASLHLSLSPSLSLCATTLTAAVTSFRHAGRQIPIPCPRLPRNSNVTASVPLLPPLFTLCPSLPPSFVRLSASAQSF